MSSNYNGWKNRQTWNCALWIENDEGLYRSAVAFMQSYTGRRPYLAFCDYAGLTGERTPDRIAWTGNDVCLSELNAMMQELIA